MGSQGKRKGVETLASNYDLVVIGGGTAGLVSAAGAASLGARVALVERDKLGGDCLCGGRVPMQVLAGSTHIASLINRSRESGIETAGHKVGFPTVTDRMERVLATVEHDDPERCCKLGVGVFAYEFRFGAPFLAAVEGHV